MVLVLVMLKAMRRKRRSRDDMLGIAIRYLVYYTIGVEITSVSMISDLLLLLLLRERVELAVRRARELSHDPTRLLAVSASTRS